MVVSGLVNQDKSGNLEVVGLKWGENGKNPGNRVITGQ